MGERTTRAYAPGNHGLPLAWLAGCTVVSLFALLFAAAAALAHDDGRFVNSPLKTWFDGLRSGKGLCCSFADGVSIQDVDWDTASVVTADGAQVRYRVRLNGAMDRRPARSSSD